MKILIIEDEPDLQATLRASLEKERYTVEAAHTFASAIDKIGIYDYDCILLDIGLPGGSGFGILQELNRLQKAGNVIVISAKDSLDDKVEGLNLGADDYLVKPFHLAELNARINSVLRRKAFGGQTTLQVGNLAIDYQQRTASVNGKPLALNRKEFDSLLYLAVNKNRLVNKTAFAEHVWGDHADEADDFKFIYSQIKNLRKKLRAEDAQVEIQAVYGIGYKLTEG